MMPKITTIKDQYEYWNKIRRDSAKKSIDKQKEKPRVYKKISKNKSVPIKPASKKTKKENSKYAKMKAGLIVLEENVYCQARLTEQCIIEAQPSVDVHHTYFGKDRSKYKLISYTWKFVCRGCHDKIHNMSTEELLEAGLRKIDY